MPTLPVTASHPLITSHPALRPHSITSPQSQRSNFLAWIRKRAALHGRTDATEGKKGHGMPSGTWTSTARMVLTMRSSMRRSTANASTPCASSHCHTPRRLHLCPCHTHITHTHTHTHTHVRSLLASAKEERGEGGPCLGEVAVAVLPGLAAVLDGAEARHALLVHEDAQRLERGDHDVDAEVELGPVDQQRVRDVPRHHRDRLLLNLRRRVAHQPDPDPLAARRRLDDVELVRVHPLLRLPVGQQLRP
eukprot:2223591-Rhodomonas_salina.1